MVSNGSQFHFCYFKSIGKAQQNSEPSVIAWAFLNKTEPYSRFGHLRSLQNASFFDRTILYLWVEQNQAIGPTFGGYIVKHSSSVCYKKVANNESMARSSESCLLTDMVEAAVKKEQRATFSASFKPRTKWRPTRNVDSSG